MNSRSDIAEQKISKLQDSNRNIQNVTQKRQRIKSKKTNQKNRKQGIRELWKNSSSLNIYEAIVTRNFTSWIKTVNPQIQETQ